jgi:hypothetical protein
MTPQEKAKELVDKYFELYIDNHTCKKCALIAVDEILSELMRIIKEMDKLSQLVTGFKTAKDFDENMKHIKEDQLKPYFVQKSFYWQEVKNEIEKL